MSSATDLARTIEALLFLSPDPVAVEEMVEACEVAEVQVRNALDVLAEELAPGRRGIVLKEVAGGYALATEPQAELAARRLLARPKTPPLTQAQSETLAIVAYKQPISRAQVASIRGVDPDGVIRTLQARGYIDEVGRDAGPGQAILFGTTAQFLEKLGIDTLDDLPPIAEFIPDADIVEALEHGLRVETNDGSQPA